jgi:methyl-accepting chemotaxis protein
MNSASQNLAGAVDTMAQLIGQNSATTDQMTVNSAEVTRAVENIASISQENSAAFEEVAASAEEMASQVDLVTQSAASLAGMADELEQVVAQFMLGGAVEVAAPEPAPEGALSGQPVYALN